MKKVAVVMGRWQLLHNGHMTLIQKALSTAENVVVVIGSAWRSRSCLNPWTWQERQAMLEAALTPAERARVQFLPIRDYGNDDEWTYAIERGVTELFLGGPVTLVGFEKDASSYYLKLFPKWSYVHAEREHMLDATSLRGLYLEKAPDPLAYVELGKSVPDGVVKFLKRWAQSKAFEGCAREHAQVKAYRAKWTADRYDTADNVLMATYQGKRYVALVRRKEGTIGEGLWALPGGFVDPDEAKLAAAMRELQEETGYKGSLDELAKSLKGEKVFDDPRRSPRGPLVTTAFHFDLGCVEGRPALQGQDDVDLAEWIDLNELARMEDQLFEDHALILRHFGLLTT